MILLSTLSITDICIFWYSYSWQTISTGTSYTQKRPAPFASLEAKLIPSRFYEGVMFSIVLSPKSGFVFCAPGSPPLTQSRLSPGPSCCVLLVRHMRRRVCGHREDSRGHGKPDHPNTSSYWILLLLLFSC